MLAQNARKIKKRLLIKSEDGRADFYSERGNSIA